MLIKYFCSLLQQNNYFFNDHVLVFDLALQKINNIKWVSPQCATSHGQAPLLSSVQVAISHGACHCRQLKERLRSRSGSGWRWGLLTSVRCAADLSAFTVRLKTMPSKPVLWTDHLSPTASASECRVERPADRADSSSSDRSCGSFLFLHKVSKIKCVSSRQCNCT